MPKFNLFRLSFTSDTLSPENINSIKALCQSLWISHRLEAVCGSIQLDFRGGAEPRPDQAIFINLLKNIESTVSADKSSGLIRKKLAKPIVEALEKIKDESYKVICEQKMRDLGEFLSQKNLKGALRDVLSWLTAEQQATAFYCYIDAEKAPSLPGLLLLLKFAFALNQALHDADFTAQKQAAGNPDYIQLVPFIMIPKNFNYDELQLEVLGTLTLFANQYEAYQKAWNKKPELNQKIVAILKANAGPHTLAFWQTGNSTQSIMDALCHSDPDLSQQLAALNQLYTQSNETSISAALLFILSRPEVQPYFTLKSSLTMAALPSEDDFPMEVPSLLSPSK